MATEITENLIQEWKEAFALYDKDNNGVIDSKELGTVLRAAGLNPSNAEIDDMISEIDSNNDGVLQFEEFKNLMTMKLPEAETEDQVLEAFKLFDTNGDGWISAQELRHVMTTLGEKMTEEEADEMLAEADSDKNGKIDYKEFASIMLMKL